MGVNLALTATGVWLSPSEARADPAVARAHFDKGRSYFEVDQYDKAIEEFKAAHVERPDPAFLYDIAECYRRKNEPRDALVYYRRFLALAPPKDPSRAVVDKRIAEMQALADAIRPESATLPEPAPASAGRSAAPLPSAPDVPSSTSAMLIAPPSTPVASGEPPVYRRAWFIATCAAVVVAGAIGVWALSRGADVPGTPLGNQPAFQ
jgi:hypothetical protein